MACVMASDSQILALCTMFTEDIFAYYGHKERFGEKAPVWTGRAFVVIITIIAHLIALELKDKAGIFELAIRLAFSGFAALAPLMLAALFWKRSTKWGALAAVLWVAITVLGTWWLYNFSAGVAPKPGQPPVLAREFFQRVQVVRDRPVQPHLAGGPVVRDGDLVLILWTSNPIYLCCFFMSLFSWCFGSCIQLPNHCGSALLRECNPRVNPETSSFSFLAALTGSHNV